MVPSCQLQAVTKVTPLLKKTRGRHFKSFNSKRNKTIMSIGFAQRSCPLQSKYSIAHGH